MKYLHNPGAAQRFEIFSRVTALLSVILGCSVFLGWILDAPFLLRVSPDLPTMKPNTAICFALSGLSLSLWHLVDSSTAARPVLRLGAILSATTLLVVASVTLSQYVFGWNSGLDQLIIKVPVTDAASPGRMSSVTAFEFVLVGLSLLLLVQPHRATLSQSIAAIVMLIALVAFLSYTFKAELVHVDWFSSIAIHTALGFILLGAAIATIRPDQFWIRAFTRNLNSSRIGRHLVLATLLILPVIAILRIEGQRTFNQYGTYFGSAILTVAGIAALWLVTWLNTRRGNAAEREINNLNRVHAMLSGVNNLIIRTRNKDELFVEACRIAHHVGRFSCAWIATRQEPNDAIHLEAIEGCRERQLRRSQLLPPKETGQSSELVEQVLSAKRAVVINDIDENDRRRWALPTSLDQQTQSLAALPLVVDHKPVGIFVLHARHAGIFDDSEMQLLTELASDISFALQNINQQVTLELLTNYDPLTRLPNRSFFLDIFERALASAQNQSQRVVMVLVDLKRFRKVNDALGWRRGDELLVRVARRLREIAPEPQTLARLGADCFVTFITVDHDQPLDQIVDRLLKEDLGAPISIDGKPIEVEATFGISIFPADGSDPESLLRNAEAALKEAKETRRDFLFYEPEINAHVAEALRMEAKLRAALDQGDFLLHYQPKVDSENRELRGVEALIRWNDPENGLVSPGEFIPVLEQSGLIVPVGEWVMRQAISDIRRWAEMGLEPPRVAINVSALQLSDRKFLDTLFAALEDFGDLKPLLDLEITETVIMDDIQRGGSKLAALHGHGLEISIDDFGTGYSSLAYLARLPINNLKVDRSFVLEIPDSQEATAIVSAIISLAHSLGIKVVAEGVETEEKANSLRKLGCDVMQGFLFGKPETFETLTERLRGG